MTDPSIDEIESLLQELEAAGGNTTAARKKPTATPAAVGALSRSDASPPAASRISFSTYTSPARDFVEEEERDNSMSRAALAGKKLVPLGVNPVAALPNSGTKSALLSTKTVLADVSPSSRSAAAQAAASAAVAPSEKDSEVLEQTEPNFLPVMHARFVAATAGITPRARWGHSLTSIGGSMLMLGGALAGEGSATNDFFELIPNPAIATWEPAFTAKGNLPSPRLMHAACSYLEKYLVVFGGCGTNYSSPLSDLHLYDTVTQTWSVAFAQPQQQAGTTQQQRNEPTGRYGSSIVVSGDVAYIFGGKCQKRSTTSEGGVDSSKQGHVLSNEVFVFKIGRQQWRKRIRDESSKNDGGAEEPDGAKGSAAAALWPPRRFAHAAAMHHGELFIHGGEGAQGVMLSDTWALNVSTKTWRLVHGGQTADAVPRSRHALFACGEALLAVGGCTLRVPPNKNETFLSVLPLTEAEEQQNGRAPWLPVTLANSALIPSSKKLFGAAFHRGFVYVFGGVAGADGASNQLVRFLAADGVHRELSTAESSLPLTAQMLRLRDKNHGIEDIGLNVQGSTIGAHKFILQLRAPKFLEDVLRCRSEPSGEQLSANSGGYSIYQLVGNSRVKGLEISSTLSSQLLEAFISYLYAGLLPDAEDDATITALREIAAIYSIAHLQQALLGNSADEDLSRTLKSNRGLVQDLQSLLQNGAGANTTILFVDPHTERQVVQSVHSTIVMNASDLFAQLLKPILAPAGDGTAKVTQSNVVNGITATLGRSASSKRGVIVGPVPIPSLAVRHVMKFLYTAELAVPPEAALPTMMAAFTLKLPRLQAHCESIVAREEVNFQTCCDFLSLAVTYQAPMLEELSLLTAGVGYSDVSRLQAYQNLDPAQKQRVDKIGQELRGHWVTPAAPATEQKSPSAYAARMQKS